MELTAEDEALVQSIQFGKKPAASSSSSQIKRLDEEDERRLEEERQREAAKVAERLATAAAAQTRHPSPQRFQSFSKRNGNAPRMQTTTATLPIRNPPPRTRRQQQQRVWPVYWVVTDRILRTSSNYRVSIYFFHKHTVD